MLCFDCLACKTRLHSTESEADPIGDLCPVCGSLLEPVADLGEIVGYGVIETRGSTSHSRAPRAGELSAGRVGEIISLDASSSTPYESSSDSKAATLTLLVHECRPSAFALPREPLRRDCRASSQLSTWGRRRREPRRHRNVRTLSWSAGHAAPWDRLSGAG
jgi:hypothetical protein